MDNFFDDALVFLGRLGFAGLLIAPIAWIVFAVTQHRLKQSFTETQRKPRRVLRTVSLIFAVFFTICVICLFLGLYENPSRPIPT